jgi:hypothetical protein
MASKKVDPKTRVSDKDLERGRKAIKTRDPVKRTPDKSIKRNPLSKIYGF